MTTFTKEQLIEAAKFSVNHWRGAIERHPKSNDFKIQLAVSEIALAALTAEPVGYEIDYGKDDLPGRYVVTGNKAAAMEREEEGLPVRGLIYQPKGFK